MSLRENTPAIHAGLAKCCDEGARVQHSGFIFYLPARMRIGARRTLNTKEMFGMAKMEKDAKLTKAVSIC